MIDPGDEGRNVLAPGPGKDVWRAEIVADGLKIKVEKAKRSLSLLEQRYQDALWELKIADIKDTETPRCNARSLPWLDNPQTLCVRREGHSGFHRIWQGNKKPNLVQWKDSGESTNALRHS